MPVESVVLGWPLNFSWGSLGELPKRLLSAFFLLALVGGVLKLGDPYTLIFVLILTIGLGAEVTQLFLKQPLPRKGISIFVVALLSALLFCVLLCEGLVASGGIRVLAWVCLTVWAYDSAAYGFGRLFGGPRLAPRISPGKTWSGCIGGLGGGGLAGLLFLYSQGISPSWSLGALTFWVILCAQGGDLLESAAKRFWGVKDSGALIPGHGGLWDRLDGLLFAFLGLGLLNLLISLGKLPPQGGGYVSWVETFF